MSFSAVKETLESRGVLNHLKARIRAEVFSALEDQREPRPFLSHENLLVNELIREYLEFNKYRYAASVLTAGGSRQASSSPPPQNTDSPAFTVTSQGKH